MRSRGCDALPAKASQSAGSQPCARVATRSAKRKRTGAEAQTIRSTSYLTLSPKASPCCTQAAIANADRLNSHHSLCDVAGWWLQETRGPTHRGTDIAAGVSTSPLLAKN